MPRINMHARIRTYAIGLAVIAAAATSGSCLFDTKTSRCEIFGVRCLEGYTCAAAQAICIPNVNGCGNALRDPDEVCDDGNVLDGDGCSANCRSTETCGNGILDVTVGEVCDGNVVGGGRCSSDCRSIGVCGNGIVDIAVHEVCDDGNIIGGDGCSADCLTEVCGNGIVDIAVGEVCDDWNIIGGDGCSADCRSREVCGNGIVDIAVGEVCDDGNTIGGDGCSADCRSTA
jgi:cysteine-rich repeat protein